MSRAETYCQSYCKGQIGSEDCHSIASCVAQQNCLNNCPKCEFDEYTGDRINCNAQMNCQMKCFVGPDVVVDPGFSVDPLGYVNINTFTSILSYLQSNDKFNFSTIVTNLKSGNYTTSSKSTKSIPFQTITTITVPYNENGDKVSFFIIYDSGNNTYFFEIPRVLSNNSKDQGSIAYSKQTDGSISGKIILPKSLNKYNKNIEFPFTIDNKGIIALPNSVSSNNCQFDFNTGGCPAGCHEEFISCGEYCNTYELVCVSGISSIP
jgi:hypothetical protein